MHNIVAIFKKQIKDTLKNKTVLIQFVMFPVFTVIMNHAMKIEGMPKNYFVILFGTMYMGMAPLTSMTAIMSEEREKHTLRVLMMSNVKPYEYFVGIGGYVWFACMIGMMVICGAGDYEFQERAVFLVIMASGIFTSLVIGAVIGTFSRTQMMATSVSVPAMMLVSFLPMLSMFNETIAKAARLIYSEQISRMLGQIGTSGFAGDMPFDGGSPFGGGLTFANGFPIEGVCVIVANIIIAAALFVAAYKKCGLD